MTEYATPLWAKLGIAAGHRVLLLDAPPHAETLLAGLPPGVTQSRRYGAGFDVAVVFATVPGPLQARVRQCVAGMPATSSLWLAWPKKSSALAHRLDFDTVQATGLAAALVDNKSCAIDADWQALRFVVRVRDRPGWPGGG
jgi:hypothetical protein